MENTNWDKVNLQKRNDIAWQGAKRAAVDLMVAVLTKSGESEMTIEAIQDAIKFWSEWIYQLEPAKLKKQAPKGRVTPSQKDYLKVLYLQKEDKEVDDEFIDSMGVLTASKEITRLKAMPTINNGDDKNGPSDNIEGEKTIDYDKDTGQLIP